MTDSNKQSITEEIDLNLPADLTSRSTQKENKHVESKLFKFLKHIVLVGSGLSLTALMFLLFPKKAHAVPVSVSAYSTTTSSTAAPSTMGRTLSLESSSLPLSPVGMSHACNVPLANSNPPYSSALIVGRSKQVPTFQNRSLIASQDPVSKRCSAITLRQSSSKVSHGKLTQKKSQLPIFSKSPIFLENDFTCLIYQWKKRRPLVKGRKRRVVIRGLHSKPLQHQGRFSLAKYVNSHRRIPLRTRRIPLRIPLLQRPRKRSVWVFSLNNDEKESKEGFDLGIIIRSSRKIVFVVSSRLSVVLQTILPILINVNVYYQTHVSFIIEPIIQIGLDVAPKIENLVNILKAAHEVFQSLEKSSTKGKQKMFTVLEYKHRQQEMLQEIKANLHLKELITNAVLIDANRMEKVARPELATNQTLVRLNTLQDIWDCKETQILINLYRIDKPQYLHNSIVATQYLSFWTPDLPIHVSSARFRQRMLERAAYFTGKIQMRLNHRTALEGSSFKQPPSEKELYYTQLSLFSHALPILDTEIKKKEEIYPSEKDKFWVWEDHERELISTSFEQARTRYEELTGSNVLENDLQQCIDNFLKGDIL